MTHGRTVDRRSFLRLVGAGGAAIGTSSFSTAGTSGSALPTRMLGRTGARVTVFGLGGYTGMKEKPSKEFDPVAMAHTAIDLGVRYLDTAPSYGAGQSETNYGRVLADRRDEVFLATKIGQRSYDGAMREVEASLKRLRTDHVDLLQIHGARVKEDLSTWGRRDGVYAALRKLRDQKITRFIGVTGHESAEVMCQAVDMYEFDTVLTVFNPMQRRRAYQRLVLPAAKRKEMGVIAMKVMGGALGSLVVGNPKKNDGKPNHDDAAQQATAEQLIRYVLSLPVALAVIGCASIDQLRMNVVAARQPPLAAAQRHKLERLMNDG